VLEFVLFSFLIVNCVPCVILEYGGSLSNSSELDDPLHGYIRSASSASHPDPPSADLIPTPSYSRTELVPLPVPTDTNAESSSHHLIISPTSSNNPFYGYEVSFNAHARSSSQYGRRRKRDLLRMLLRLFWMRWRKQIITLLSLLLVWLAYALDQKLSGKWRWRWRMSGFSALMGGLQTTPLNPYTIAYQTKLLIQAS